MLSTLLAINWEPELRGILIVIIAVVVLPGSIYMILATNMGGRLGFLVALAGLAGWMFIMGAVWWSYGKGLLGSDPSWKPMNSQTILSDPLAINSVGILDKNVTVADGATPQAIADQFSGELVASNWESLDPSLPSFQQAAAAAGVMLEENGSLPAGGYKVVNVFNKGGERYPSFFDDKVDFLAFMHKPHYALVEVVPLVTQREEPGRAPASAIVDTARNHEYVYMIRDLGNKRQPAGMITIGSLLVFLVLCWLLHTRDRRVVANRSAKALPQKA